MPLAIALALVSSLLTVAPQVEARSDQDPPRVEEVDLRNVDLDDERSPGPANTDTRLTEIANRVWRGEGPIPEGYSPGSTLVAVELFPAAGTFADLETYLVGAGATDLVRLGDMLSVAVPAALLEALGSDPRVQWAQPASVPVAEAVTGEGIAVIDADQWQTAGWTGSGVKVAVVDLGFNGYSALLGTELPASVTTQDYCGAGVFTGGTVHGTAVAEIVHEVAPDASLYLICVDSLGDLSSAVTYAIANGITIISHSVGWFNTGRGDGTGSLQPILENARNNGILWVNSAGNYAKQHWSGTFLDTFDADGLHEFTGGGDETNDVLAANGDVISVRMKWDDWPTTSVDYDLYLFNDALDTVLASSTDTQNGTQPPDEQLSWQNTTGSTATVHVVIDKFGGPATTPSIDLFTLGGSDIEHQVTARSLNDASTSPVVVAAAASNQADGVIESFSSRGPTIDARTKPDVSGPDRVSGATYGAGGFAGTSASAPHVAAAAALLSEAKPGITPAGLAVLLRGRGVDAGDPGPDNTYGYGNLELETPPGPDGLGLVDATTADWHLRGGDDDPAVFNYGTAGYFPFVGDWDGDGVATPGMYRQSDGFALLRNSNTAGSPDVTPFFLAAPGDTIPIAGDWDGDGDDTVSWYKPSSGQFNIINDLSSTIESTFLFGTSPGSTPFAGDFNGNGSDTIGVHNGTTLSFRNSLDAGTADIEFTYGQSGDLVLTGDWDGDGDDTFGLYRPGTIEVELHNSNAAGTPDKTYTWGVNTWAPVAGFFGPLTSGVTITWDGSSATAPMGVEYVVESLYLEFPVAPTLPAGMRTNLAGLPYGPKTATLTDLVYTGTAAFGGYVSVVTAGADTILLASDDNVNWRVAGGHLSSQGKARWFGGSPRFFGVIGADITDSSNSPSPTTPLTNHADSIHIISMVPEDGAGAIVGIPRDTIMKVPYVSGWTAQELQDLVPGTLTQARADEINAHCQGQCDRINFTMLEKGGGLPSGPATTVTALELETGLDLEGYFHTGFGASSGGPAGFTDLVDAFISAFSTVFSFTAPYDVAWGGVDEGQTTVDGSEALSFGRERQTRPRGDYDRTLAQGLLIKAALANIQPLKLQSTPGLLGIMDGYVNTDLTIDQILTFAASLFVVDTGPMPSLRGFHLDILGSMAYNRNEGTIPNAVTIGCSNPVVFKDGGFAVWFTTQNWATFSDLADGTLAATPWECLSTSGTDAGAVWDAAPLGMLRVTTSPARPSQISIDGLPADTWGLNWVKIPRGTYTVSFQDMEGFTTPDPQTVVVTEGATTPVTGSFAQRGNLRVTTSTNPSVGAVPSTISIDGVPSNDWGMWTDLAPGVYEVCFGAVADYTTPACRDATVVAGSDTIEDGEFVSNPGAPGPSGFGMLRVTTSPARPSQISVDGVPYDSWGLNWVKVPPGAYEVTFSDVPGYATPLPQTVTVTDGNTTSVVGSFTQQGTLKVITSPAVPATIFVDGNPHNDWGVWTDVPAGTYQVCFSNVTGFTTPACQPAVITAGGTTTITGNFT